MQICQVLKFGAIPYNTTRYIRDYKCPKICGKWSIAVPSVNWYTLKCNNFFFMSISHIKFGTIPCNGTLDFRDNKYPEIQKKCCIAAPPIKRYTLKTNQHQFILKSTWAWSFINFHVLVRELQYPQNFGNIHTYRQKTDIFQNWTNHVQDVSKHENPSKNGSRNLSQMQYFLLLYVEESKKVCQAEN